MGKTKIADKSSKKDKKSELSSVKDGRVTKPAQTPKAKSKDVAKSVAISVKDKKDKKKSKKAKTPTPEPESSSESESESDSDASASEDSSSASSSEDEKVEKQTSSTAAKAESDSSDSSDDSESDSDEEKPAAKSNGVKSNGVAKAAAESDSSDSDSSESESDSDEEKKVETKASDDSDSSDSDSDSGSDSSESDEEDKAPSKKRKAEEVAEPTVKKTKTEAPAADSNAIANLFVGSLSWNVDEDWLRREFEHFGEIVGCRVITDRDSGRSKGFGYVEFANAADAAKAHAEMNGYQLDGRALNVDFSTPRQKPENKTNDRANKYGDKRSAPANTLFLGNLSFDCTNEGIQEIFAEYGTITRVSLPTDRETGSLKGFGYVDFTTTEEATAALEALNGQDVEGRAIRIDYAAPRADNGGAGGRGGFGGGRGGGRGGFGGRGGGRGGRGGGRGGRGGFTTNRGGFGDFQGQKKSFD